MKATGQGRVVCGADNCGLPLHKTRRHRNSLALEVHGDCILRGELKSLTAMAKGGGKGSSGRGAGKGSSNTKPRSDEVELATSQVTIGGKRFHIDVKQNNIGRFVKIREGASGKGGKGGKGGPKKVNLPSAGALQFMDALRKIASPAILKVSHTA